MKNALVAAALLAASLIAAPAVAAPINAIVADGGTFCESLNRSVFSSGDCDLGGNRDISNNLNSNDKITFLGEGRLAGYVADGTGVGNGDFPDYATITLTKGAMLTFTLLSPDRGFDAAFSFGSVASADLSGANPSISFMANAGDYFFGIDATNPSDSPVKVDSSYELTIAAIPLPAGGVLLLSGLGGLAFLRRRNKR